MERDTKVLEVDPIAVRLKAMKRGVVTASRLQGEAVPRWRPAMVTLTYRPGRDWCPSDVRSYLEHCRKFVQREGYVFRYVWVAELQGRGAVHYHVLVWLPPGVRLPKPDESGWWSYGMSRIEWAVAPIRYMIKYASKLSSKGLRFPRGLRLHGAGGLSAEARGVRRWWVAPSWVRKVFKGEQSVRRGDPTGTSAGGYFSEVTGEFIRSPWVVVMLRGGFPVIQWRGFECETSPAIA